MRLHVLSVSSSFIGSCGAPSPCLLTLSGYFFFVPTNIDSCFLIIVLELKLQPLLLVCGAWKPTKGQKIPTF